VTECALGGDASSWGNQGENDDQQVLAAMAFTSNVEKRTFVRYCGKEYVAPELMPLQVTINLRIK
jgi:tripartite-type tricarboxylate transporter receptor subunit TctC